MKSILQITLSVCLSILLSVVFFNGFYTLPSLQDDPSEADYVSQINSQHESKLIAEKLLKIEDRINSITKASQTNGMKFKELEQRLDKIHQTQNENQNFNTHEVTKRLTEQEIEALAQEHVTEKIEHLDVEFAYETFDEEWSEDALSGIESWFSSQQNLNQLRFSDCKTSLCYIELEFNNEEEYLNFDLEFSASNIDLFNSMMVNREENSDGSITVTAYLGRKDLGS